MKSVRIRHAKREDGESLVAFHSKLYAPYLRKTEGLPNPTSNDFECLLVDDIRSLLADPHAIALVAEDDANPVGYITARIGSRGPKRRIAVLEEWYVDEGARKRGIGRMLLSRLIEDLNLRGCSILESATHPANQEGRAAHLRLGFHEVQIRFRRHIGRT